MKLVLSVSAFGERAEGRCPWVWIDLSPTLARKALRRIHTVRCAEANDDELVESRFISREATFFNPWLAGRRNRAGGRRSCDRTFARGSRC